MVDINERYPKSGLFSAKNWDAEEGDLDLQIDHLELDRDFGADKVPKDVLIFRNDGRELVLNGVNARQIMKLHGKETDNWSGRWIALYLDPDVEYKGQRGGIRVRDQVPPRGGNGAQRETAQPASPPAPPLNDEIPF
jgi:hypothetical protein